VLFRAQKKKRHFKTWLDPFPKPTYLFALVVGNLEFVESNYITSSKKNIILRIYTEVGNKHLTTHAMESLKKAMYWDEANYGLEYDLDIFMIVAVSHFNMGAMENKGLNIFNSKYVLADNNTATDKDLKNVEAIVAHEYFHNWTGNRGDMSRLVSVNT
jgi:aminopeptidase N